MQSFTVRDYELREFEGVEIVPGLAVCRKPAQFIGYCVVHIASGYGVGRIYDDAEQAAAAAVRLAEVTDWTVEAPQDSLTAEQKRTVLEIVRSVGGVW